MGEFTRIERKTNGSKISGQIAVQANRKQDTTPITFGEEVADKCGLKEGDRVEMLIGRSQSTFAIVKSSEGVILKWRKRRLKAHFPKVFETQSVVYVNPEPIEGGVQFTMPEDFCSREVGAGNA